ncbi:MAG: hypothetical protein L0207_05595 [Chlamydiae bacterium]|nr:hypothetical protein [Chlamydiota bacterium]
MNFTREPIIETIITPREGYKLVIRNSKGGSREEYILDGVEIVSFGKSFFFRSLDRAKSFLLPTTDYEVVETREARIALKGVSVDRSIKIGGGREGLKTMKEPQEKGEREPLAPTIEQRMDKKRDRRRHRRRRGQEERIEPRTPQLEEEIAPEETITPTTFSRLFPPPPTLISEKLAKIKEKPPETKEVLPEQSTEEKTQQDFNQETPPESDSTEVFRVSSEISSQDTSLTTNKAPWYDIFHNPFKN